MALTFIGRSVASAIIENLINTCSSYLMAYRAAGGTQDELKRLQNALPQVQAVLTAVAEDVLDELDYYKLEKTIQDRDDKQEHCKALESLIIKQCEKLQDVPPEYFLKFNSLKFLCIEKCPKLTIRGISDIQLPSTLNELTIGSCGDLEVPLLSSANLTFLTELNLIDSARITSFPPGQVCTWRTVLSRLTIKDCKELPSFGGIQDLECLRSLEITGCDKLIEVAMSPNDVSQENAKDCCLKLGELSIDHHALLLMEPLRSLTSISSLTLSDASRLTSLPEEWILQNHTALKCLSIENAISLQSLPQSMTTLCFLQDLRVYNANLIQSLPDLPTSLQTLYITGCHPVLKERCQKNIGLDWPKIAEIPDVMIAQHL